MILYDMADSGNCYKPRLLMAKLGVPFTRVEVSSHTGATRKPDYVAKNPNAMVPMLELDDGRRIAESNAILLYLAEGTRFLPADKYERALAYQWLFFEQYSHEPYIAVVRFWRHFLTKLSPLQELDLPERLRKGYDALEVMERYAGLINATRAKLPISPANLRQRVKQHDEMIDAIVSGDLERAATVATAHIRAAREDMLMQMRQVRTGTARAAAEASLTP